MKHYFIDYENVNSTGLRGCGKIKKEDIVTIVFSENANKIDFQTLHLMLNKFNIELWKCDTGYKNSLDHQLASGLGYAIAQNRDAEYYIVSSDNAFNAVALFWKKRHVFVRRISCIEESLKDSK